MCFLFPPEILHAWGHGASLLAHLPRFYKTIFVCPKKCAQTVKPRDILLSHVAIFKKQVPESLCLVEAGKGRVAGPNRAAFTPQSLTSVVVKPRIRLTRASGRGPHPLQVGHGGCSSSPEPCSTSKSWQGLCEPALLSNPFGRLAEFWAGSQVTHWVPGQPVRASVSSSVQRQDLTLIPRPFTASTRHRQALLSGERGRAREKGDSAVSTKDKGPRGAERTQGHSPASAPEERVWGRWASELWERE